MTVQTSYVRPEDDPANWFTQTGIEGVTGPAVITALSKKEWFMEKGKERRQFTGDSLRFGKLFVPGGWTLMGYRDSIVSGYRLPGASSDTATPLP